MASTQLTDKELFSQLKLFGFTPGPVTEHTRPVYLKKLKKLREEHQQRGKSRSGGAANSTMASRPGRHDVTRLSSTRRSGPKSSVLGFSSDESDAETPLKRKGLDQSRRAGHHQQEKGSTKESSPGQYGAVIALNSTTPSERHGHVPPAAGAGKTPREEDVSDEELKNSHSVNGRGAFRLNSRKQAEEYSDSEDVGGSEGPGEGQSGADCRRCCVPLSSLDGAKNSPPEDTNASGGSEKLVANFKKRSLDSNMVPRKRLHGPVREEHGAQADRSNHTEDMTCTSAAGSGFSSGLRSRFSSPGSLAPTPWGSQPNHSPARNHANCSTARKKNSAAPDDELLLQFKGEGAPASGSFSAHYLSMFLLTAACLFFLLLGLMYIRMRGAGVLKSHPFGSNFDSSYEKDEKDLILKLLLSLHDHLATVAGHHDCRDELYPRRNVSIHEASAYLLEQNEKFKDFIHTSLEWLVRTDQDIGIRLMGNVSGDPVTDVSEVTWLESTHPRMPFICRFQRAFLTVMSKLVVVAVVIVIVWSVVFYIKYRWRREEEETRQMYDMVERIIDVLRTHGEACHENQELQPYLPIPHVRDSLVQPQDRKKMKKIWERAVCFLSANESRIRTETQRIGGSDFLVWRWIQPSLSSDKSKLWQGKAFPLDRRNSPPNSLTPCLKIRNMFDPVMEVGDNWDLAIQEAILEKCSDNDGIVHIAVDKSSREGCVYVKCLSAEHSGKAFKALHGSWFDGKLVTVKYLRLDRYHQRFPQSQGCFAPLKASSPHQNSSSCQQQHGVRGPSGFL